MAEYISEGLREEDVRRIVRDEITGRGEAPPQEASIADPTPVGLAAFALTTFLFSIITAGWLEQIGTFIPLAFFYGGLAQLLAGMWEFRNNNTFGAVVFTSYGALWGAFGFLFFSGESLGGLDGPSVGFTLVGWTVFTFYMWIASTRVHKAMFVTFTMFMITLILLDLGFLFDVPALVVIGGYAGIVLAICAWYASAAGVLNHTFGRVVLPLGTPFQQPKPEPAPATQDHTTESTTPETTTEEITIESATQEITEEPTTPESQPPPEEPPDKETEPTRPQPATTGLTTVQAASQEPAELAQHRGREEAEEVVVQDTGEAQESRRAEIRRIIRESVVRSEMGRQEAPQAETPAAPEILAGTEELPIEDYDSLNMAQITKRLGGLSVEEVERLQDYEANNENRRSLLVRFDKRIRAAREDDTSGQRR